MGFQQSSYAVGRVLGPPLAGSAFDRFGVWSPMVFGGIITAIAALLAVAWRINRNGPADAVVTTPAH